MNRATFNVQLKRVRDFVARILSFWLLLATGIAGIAIVFLDTFSDLGLVQEKTQVVIGVNSSLLLLYLLLERAQVLEDIRERVQIARVKVYPSREAVYTAIPDVIASVPAPGQGEKQMLMAALHGHRGDRIARPEQAIPAFEAFDAACRACIMSSGPGMWNVRHIYNITTEERLNMIEQYLVDAEKADGYEARAFCVPDAIPHLSPLVLGPDRLFIALEDPRYYRVSKAIYLENEDAVKIAREYFDALWNHTGVVVLRSPIRIEKQNIEKLRQRIRSRQGALDTLSEA